MTETQRETAGAVRSAHVAHFFPPDWAQTAQRASGALERSDRALAAPQLVVTVPDSLAAIALGLGHCSLGCQWRDVRRMDIVPSRLKSSAV